MLGRREFLVIDKNRVVYQYKNVKIAIDDIKNFGCGVEFEIDSYDNRDEEVNYLEGITGEFGLKEEDVLASSKTVLAMKALADSRD